MSSLTSRRPFLPVLFVSLVILVGVSLPANGALARPGGSPAKQVGSGSPRATRNAFAHLSPVNGAPPNGGAITIGTKFTLDLLVNTGSNQDTTATQNYITFDGSVLQVVSPGGNNCTPSGTVAADTTTFDTVLQNNACNGPHPCESGGLEVPAGTISYASGVMVNCPQGCGGDFRVASVTFCAINGGRATIHWQFSPPAPTTRDSEILNLNGDFVHNPSLYRDYVINVSGPTATPGPPTWTPVPAPTATPTALPPAGCNMNFGDVPSSDPFYSVIQSMYCSRVISGYSDGTFRPYDYTMRAQIAKIVVLAFGFETNTAGGPHFADVPRGNEFYNYIETAYNLGLVSGYENRQFRPWENVKRGQIAKIVVLAATRRDPTHWQLANPPAPSFRDVPTSNVFYRYVETAKAHNLIAGFSDGTFGVDSFAKRGQICKIVAGAPINP